MDLEQWRQLRELSEACAALPPGQRDDWLREHVPDAEMRARVLAMLEDDTDDDTHRADADSVWQRAVASLAEPGDRSNQAMGAWRLIRPIGDGGMGHVYLAERIEGGFTQRAAIKCLRHGYLTPEFIARFESERQILARLEHPGIARLLDGGRDASGEPWLAMEYVDGETLVDYCDHQRLGITQRLQLFLDVCAAVSHAHARLVVHRDIKPSNVLVNNDGQVKLLDFGVAKLMEESSNAYQTGTAIAPMTPAYAAPEQLRGEPPSTVMDIYALGVMLFELLSGVLPYRLGASGAEAAAAVLNSQPVAASSAFQRHSTGRGDRERIAEARKQSPKTLRKTLSGDLDAILLKALRPDQSARYQTVQLFSADIERYLQHRPVVARRGSWRYRARLFLRRHALASALGVIALLTLVGGLVQAKWQAAAIAEQRDRAETEANRAKQALAFLQETFRQADPARNRGQQLSAKDLLLLGQQRLLDGQQSSALDAWLMEELVRAEQVFGLVEEPDLPLSAALGIYQRLGLGRDAARVKVGLANSTSKLRTQEEGEKLVREALEELGPDAGARTLAIAHHSLGNILGNRGLHAEAITELRTAATFWRKSGANVQNGPSTTAMLLAYFLGANGENAEAEQLLRATLDKLRDAGPDAALDRAEIESTLGIRMRRAGRIIEAEALQSSALSTFDHMLGRDHPVYWTVLGNLGSVWTMLGRHEEAVEAQRGRLDYRRRTLGEQAQSTGLAWKFYAGALQHAGRSSDAEEAMRKALGVFRVTQGESSLHVAEGLILLGHAQLAAGHRDAALQSTQQGIDMLHALNENNPPLEASALRIQAQALHELGQQADACAHVDRMLDRFADPGGEAEPGLDTRIRLTAALCPNADAPMTNATSSPADDMTRLPEGLRQSRDEGLLRLVKEVAASQGSG